jgi:hypothetical protein
MERDLIYNADCTRIFAGPGCSNLAPVPLKATEQNVAPGRPSEPCGAARGTRAERTRRDGLGPGYHEMAGDWNRAGAGPGGPGDMRKGKE